MRKNTRDRRNEGSGKRGGKQRIQGGDGRMKAAAMAIGLLLSAGTAVGVGYAAFSAKGEAAENKFTIQAGESGGKIENEDKTGTGVVEPGWPTEDKDKDGIPDEAENLQPGSVVPKNPKFVSPLSYDAWVALKVEVPATVFQIEGDSEASVHDCVSLQELNKDGKWTLLYQKKTTVDGDRSVYYYGYQEIVKGKKKGETRGGETGYLFQSIRVPDIVSLSVKKDGTGFSGNVSVTPYAVQAEGYGEITDAKAILMSLAGLKS